jgi:hypothetical protein
MPQLKMLSGNNAKSVKSFNLDEPTAILHRPSNVDITIELAPL